MGIITFNQAYEQFQDDNEKNNIKKERLLQEFLDSNHELLTARDLLYYSEETDKPISWFFENSETIDPVMKMAYDFGADIDDLIALEI